MWVRLGNTKAKRTCRPFCRNVRKLLEVSTIIRPLWNWWGKNCINRAPRAPPQQPRPISRTWSLEIQDCLYVLMKTNPGFCRYFTSRKLQERLPYRNCVITGKPLINGSAVNVNSHAQPAPQPTAAQGQRAPTNQLTAPPDAPALLSLGREQQYAAIQLSHYVYTLLCIISQLMTTNGRYIDLI